MSVYNLQETAFEATKATPCPLCDHDHYCYLVQDAEGSFVKAVCQWAGDAPEDWDRSGTAKDGRGIFTRKGYRQRRKHYPDQVRLAPEPKPDIPQWQPCISDMSGNPIALARDGKAQELAIEYPYPDLSGSPMGRVIRIQWSDRRRAYENNRKTKMVRPWHWVNHVEGGFWSDRGKGDKTWTLYREAEAQEAIVKGGIVFAVAGEQAVETYRELGLTAVTNQGGESNHGQIIERLKDSFKAAKDSGLKPVLVIHPDNDITGDRQFGEDLLKECGFAKIPAVVLEPTLLWREIPPGGDIWDIVHRSGMSNEQILKALEATIDTAIDRQEEELKAGFKRDRWKAPVAWEGELGYWKEFDGNRIFTPQCDFDFQVERELLSDDGGGLMLQVKLADRRSQQRVFIKSIDCTTAQKFKDALKRALGCMVISNLNNYQTEALLRTRIHEYRTTRQGKAYRLIDRVGQQQDGSWVFKDRQLSYEGESIDELQSLWVWNAKLTGEENTIPAPAIVDPNPQALKDLVDIMRRAFGSNFPLAMLTLGYAAAGVHYQEILAKEGAFPILNAYGDPGSGKTTAAECALSLAGMHQDGMMCDVSLSAAYERLKLSGSLIHCLDDPARNSELNTFLKGFYNGKPRVVRGKEVSFNVQRPHSPLMVTTNHACGENDAATQSRLIRLFFPKTTDGDIEAFHELPAAQRLASGCLPDIIKLGYPGDEVHALERELTQHLPNAHVRIGKSLALMLYYAMKVAALAGAAEDLKGYVLKSICPEVNDPEESGDSIRDFLEKIFELQSRSKIGDWNMRMTEKRETGDRVLAIYMPGVWAVLDREYNLIYNRKVIESLLVSLGVHKTTHKFHRSEDESRTYYRLRLSQGQDSSGALIEPTPPEMIGRKAIEIPIELLQMYSEKNQVTQVTQSKHEAETQAQHELPELPKKGNSLVTQPDILVTRPLEPEIDPPGLEAIDPPKTELPFFEAELPASYQKKGNSGNSCPEPISPLCLDRVTEVTKNSQTGFVHAHSNPNGSSSEVKAELIDQGANSIPDADCEVLIGDYWVSGKYIRETGRSRLSKLTRTLESGHKVLTKAGNVEVTDSELRRLDAT